MEFTVLFVLALLPIPVAGVVGLVIGLQVKRRVEALEKRMITVERELARRTQAPVAATAPAATAPMPASERPVAAAPAPPARLRLYPNPRPPLRRPPYHRPPRALAETCGAAEAKSVA